ncbi:hypothetical protein [Algibacillus agarilyticus]|uniref:hypothetical protein n=1 Tax=Algibacillus agarilyticus TaxID=2234133 RepID=UPI000DD028E7|nr:hypothetical protein [Algibacillus agarilyticus]
MINAELISILWMGFIIGLVHAFDADHIMAVSAMAQKRSSQASSLFYAVNWGLGHGAILLLAGMLMFVFNIALPLWLVVLAEQAVGVLLIFLGLALMWQFYRDRITLVAHKHGAITHVHWLNKTDHNMLINHEVMSDNCTQNTHRESLKHKPILVGMLHGLAGSAPVIALIPAMMQKNGLLSLAYMVLFSTACVVGMTLFGYGLKNSQQFMATKLNNFNRILRCGIAFMSIGLGVFWLFN